MLSLQDLDLSNPNSNLFDLIIKGYIALTAVSIAMGIIGCLLTIYKVRQTQETLRVNALRRTGIQAIDVDHGSGLSIEAPISTSMRL